MKLLLLFLFISSAFAAESRGTSPLARPLRLNLANATLTQTAAAIREQTGVEVAFYRPDFPDNALNAPNVTIATGNVPLAIVMEALAKNFNFRFRVTRDEKVEVSRGYGWTSQLPSLRFVRTRPLTEQSGQSTQSAQSPQQEIENDALKQLLAEMAKTLALLEGDFTFRFEPYPLPDSPDNTRGTLVLPEIPADYLERGIRCLSGENGDYPPPNGPARPALFARARNCEPDWEDLLSRRVRAPEGKDVHGIIRDVAADAGVAIVVRTLPGAPGPQLDADLERYTFGRISEILSREWGLGRRVFLCPGAVVFEGGEPALETDARTREFFWDGLAVAGFDARAAVERVKGAAALTTLLRRDVFPGLWRDPACSMTYSPASGRLAVVAPANVMPAIAERIRELGRTGQ